jgi:chlorobactene glucosyltransferase
MPVSGTRHPTPLTFAGLALVTGITALGTRLGLSALRQQQKVPPLDALAEQAPTPDGEWPLVSLIVPARNEERNLPRLLPGLLRQRYPNYEVIVVDDASTDATSRILREWEGRSERLRVVHGGPLPEGWRGKPWAMCQGARVARGEWLLFTDADTHHSPLSVSSSVAYALRNGIELLTILPHSELGTPAERVIMPTAHMGIANLYPAYRVNDPSSKLAIANGQYILIRREVYDGVGGIKRVKKKIAEDLEFAEVVKGEGYRLYLADGRHLMSVRMYTTLGEIWEGWSKNVVLSFKGRPSRAALTIAAFLSVSLFPFMVARWAGSLWRKADRTGSIGSRAAATWAGGLALWQLVFPFAYRRMIDRMMGLPAGWTLTLPLGIAAMLGIMLHSLARLLTGKGVTWKGRKYHS